MSENLKGAEKPKTAEPVDYTVNKPKLANSNPLGKKLDKPRDRTNHVLPAPNEPSPIKDLAKPSMSPTDYARASSEAYKKFLGVIGAKPAANGDYPDKSSLRSLEKGNYSVKPELAEGGKVKGIRMPLLSTSSTEDYVSALAYIDSNRGAIKKGSLKPSEFVFEESNLSVRMFSDKDGFMSEINKKLKDDENYHLSDWIKDWHEKSDNAAAYRQLVKDSQYVGVPVNKLAASDFNVSSANSLLSSVDNLFGSNLNSGTLKLHESFSISYEKYLTSLKKLNPHDNSESWSKFFEKMFSGETWAEIGSVFLDAASSFAIKFLNSFIPTLVFGKASGIGDIKTLLKGTKSDTFEKAVEGNRSKNKYVVNGKEQVLVDFMETLDKNYKHLLAITKLFQRDLDYWDETSITNTETATSFGTTFDGFLNILTENYQDFQELESSSHIQSINENVPAVEFALMSLLGIKYTEDVAKDQSALFKDFVSKNPLLGQHQYTLRIKKHSAKNVDYIPDRIYNELLFRAKNIDFPTYQRNTTNSIYGHSGLAQIPSLQASADNKAVINIICDRNFDVLEYLIRLSGLGICTTGGLPLEEDTLKKVSRTYNLSTVADDSYSDNLSSATLRILNGRDLAKANFMENRELQFEAQNVSALNLGLPEQGTSRGLITYGKLPVFLFENFKIINLDYPLNFDSTKIDSKLLEIKATVTWSKVKIKWEAATDLFYSSVQ